MGTSTCPKCGNTIYGPGVVTLTRCFCGWGAAQNPPPKPNLRLVAPPERKQGS